MFIQSNPSQTSKNCAKIATWIATLALGASIQALIANHLANLQNHIMIEVDTYIDQEAKTAFRTQIDRMYWKCSGLSSTTIDPAFISNIDKLIQRKIPFSNPMIKYNGNTTYFLIYVTTPKQEINHESIINEAFAQVKNTRLSCLVSTAKEQDEKNIDKKLLEELSKIQISKIKSINVHKQKYHPIFKII